MWLAALDDFLLEDYGIPLAMVTNKSSHLGFGSDRRAGVYSSMFFNSSVSTASWHVLIQCPDDASRYALMAVLAAPSTREMRLLALRELHTADYVVTNGTVSSIQAPGASNNLEVMFESNDSVWQADEHVTVTKSFIDPMDLALRLPAPGNVPTNPIIRIVPTDIQYWPLPAVGWRWRQRWTITNNADEPLFRYPVSIGFGDTTGLVAGDQALASGDDLRVWLDGLEQPRALVGWNTTSTAIWVIVPALPAGSSLTYDLVYGNIEATADHGCDLVYPDLPAFDLTMSTNVAWNYRTFADITYAGQGLWPLTTAGAAGTPDFTVPGAWRPALTFENPTNTDQVYQGPSRRATTPHQQTLSASGTVSGGTYMLRVDATGDTTAALAYNATTQQIEDALETLPGINIDEGIAATGGPLPGTPVTLTFNKELFAGKTGNQLTILSSLTGGGSYINTVTAEGELWYQTTLVASRWRGTPPIVGSAGNFGAIAEFAGAYPFDGVVFHNPFGVYALASDGISLHNQASTMTVVTTTVGDTTASDEVLVPTTPATRFVVIGRDSGGDDWHIIEERSGETFTTTFGGIWSPPGPLGMKHVGWAVWPFQAPSIPDAIEGGALVLAYGDTHVYLRSAGRLDIQQTEEEVEISELAMELRLGGGANAIGPYSTLLIGNARGLTGPGTPRAAVPLGTHGVEIDTGGHTHEVWTSDFRTKVESLSAHAVRGLEGYIHDGLTGEARSHAWLPIAPPRRRVRNGAFDADTDSWEFETVTGGVVATLSHDPTFGETDDDLGALMVTITTNPSVGQAIVLNQQRFPVVGQESIEVGAWMATDHNDIHPKLAVYWYHDNGDNSQTLLSTTIGPDWAAYLVAPSRFLVYRRTLAAVVPPGATHFRVGLACILTVSGVTGSVWFDNITLNDNDLLVVDAGGGVFDVTAIVPAQWVP